MDINLLKIEAFAKRLSADDEMNKESNLDANAKDKMEILEKTNQGISAIKKIMFYSLALYEEVEGVITKLVGPREKIMSESEREEDLSKCSGSIRLEYQQRWKELVHYEIETHRKNQLKETEETSNDECELCTGRRQRQKLP